MVSSQRKFVLDLIINSAGQEIKCILLKYIFIYCLWLHWKWCSFIGVFHLVHWIVSGHKLDLSKMDWGLRRMDLRNDSISLMSIFFLCIFTHFKLQSLLLTEEHLLWTGHTICKKKVYCLRKLDFQPSKNGYNMTAIILDSSSWIKSHEAQWSNKIWPFSYT